MVEQVDQNIVIGGIISLIGTALAIGIPYISTRNKEIEASIRQKKTERYDDLLERLTIVGRTELYGDIKSWTFMNDFIMAYYKASAYADDSVIKACNKFFKSIADHVSEDEITQRITDIYTCIRQDINPKASAVQSISFWKTGQIKES